MTTFVIKLSGRNQFYVGRELYWENMILNFVMGINVPRFIKGHTFSIIETSNMDEKIVMRKYAEVYGTNNVFGECLNHIRFPRQ